ncbi:MAG: hypothetical protein ACRENB_05370 [Gemmatimonadales bacterium]
MTEQERLHRHADGADRGADPGGEGLEQLRRTSEEHLAAGDEAIRRCLSGDSRAFLRSAKQLGGQ